jgi:hypothetical protein
MAKELILLDWLAVFLAKLSPHTSSMTTQRTSRRWDVAKVGVWQLVLPDEQILIMWTCTWLPILTVPFLHTANGAKSIPENPPPAVHSVRRCLL